MRFQKEVNIFAPDAILKRFQANETNFSVVKGKMVASAAVVAGVVSILTSVAGIPEVEAEEGE